MKNKIYKNIKDFGFTILAALLIISCASKQITSTNTNIAETEPKLIFLNYTIKKSSNASRTISLINKIITDGKLKNQVSDQNEIAEVDDLIYNQLDKNSNIVQSEIIKNPLVKTFEYVDDSNSFQMKKIELDTAQISLKLNLAPNTKYITISHIRDLNSKPEILIKTPIN